jgi:hypothetical protein
MSTSSHTTVVLTAGMLSLLLVRPVRGQDVRDADTLPANVGGIIIQPAIGYGSGLERFGYGWGTGRQSLLADVDGIPLTQTLGLPDAFKLGRLRFEPTQRSIGINFAAAFGITDRLTLAAFLPYMHASYTLNAWIEPLNGELDNTGVKNPELITCPNGEFNLENYDQFVEFNTADRFSIEDVRNLLVSDCLDYKDPIDSIETSGDRLGTGRRSYNGFKDLILGAKYQFYHARHLNLAAIGYVIAPTGKVEDPRDLFDFNFGDGQWDAALLAAATVPLGKFRIAGAAGYEISFGDTLERRLNNVSFSEDLENRLARGEISEEQLFDEHLDDASIIPIATKYDLALVERKLGDTFYIYSGAGYEVLEWLSVGVSLDFMHHFRDRIDAIGPRYGGAPAYKSEAQARAEIAQQSFESEEARVAALRAALSNTEGRRRASYAWHTVRGSLVGGVSINFNTLGPFLRDEFPLPLIASLSISRFIAGQNIDTPDQLNLSVIVPIPLGTVKDPAEYGFDDEGGGLPWP